MGFIETPYRKVTNGVVDLVSTPIYLSAEEEEGMLISPNIQMDNSGKLLPKTHVKISHPQMLMQMLSKLLQSLNSSGT
jgi:DNA-directed RNA polymerase beta subunit